VKGIPREKKVILKTSKNQKSGASRNGEKRGDDKDEIPWYRENDGP